MGTRSACLRDSFSDYNNLQGHQLGKLSPSPLTFLGQVQGVSLFPITAEVFIDPTIQELEEQQ